MGGAGAMPGKSRIHVRVYGRVQGVFFRAFTKSVAEDLGLKGWVRNVEDGSVEIVAEGNEEDLRKFLEEVRRGPPAAIVEKVDVEWEDYTGEFMGFAIRR